MPKLPVEDLASLIGDMAPAQLWGALIMHLHRSTHPLASSLLTLCVQLRKLLPPSRKCMGAPMMEVDLEAEEPTLRLVWTKVNSDRSREGYRLNIEEPGRGVLRHWSNDGVGMTAFIVRWNDQSA